MGCSVGDITQDIIFIDETSLYFELLLVNSVFHGGDFVGGVNWWRHSKLSDEILNYE